MILSSLSLPQLPPPRMKGCKTLCGSSDSGISGGAESPSSSSASSSTLSSDSLPDPETQVIYEAGDGDSGMKRSPYTPGKAKGESERQVDHNADTDVGDGGKVKQSCSSAPPSPGGESTGSSSTATGSDSSCDHGLGCSAGRASASGHKSERAKRRKKERFEICIGYPCFHLQLDESKTVSVYTLQKNQDMMEDLLGHSKLKSSKSFLEYFSI